MIPNRLVLDTNVLLDLFIFHDPRWAALLLALQHGKAEAVTRADCRDEWHLVLRYPHLPLNEETRPAAEAQFDSLISLVTAPAGSMPLPTCSDRDDQKFLELARDAQAAMLVTKDKALLKLARRAAKAGMFRILTPEAWVREHEAAQEAAKLAAVPLE
ncbi:putative toxin-antitoxin system toxin component, PIN family [Noviherbaspirillum soli]|uniref:putative toxin-antitoxin system toxin component, PIN family n=1 Tax=Noviherbaspirillum soli TaxID=1064518 RepID=UPI00188C851B|nr:putative toxin-antitoxin system toxin component, PIN family [Noviherbaspirillum soli]